MQHNQVNAPTLVVRETADAYTLPTAVGIQYSIYNIKNNYNGDITINTTSAQTIDGQTSGTIGYKDTLSVQSDGSNWQIV